MRPSKLAVSAFLALFTTSGAYADWTPAGPYTFTQGQTYELYFETPATDLFLAADITVQYSPLVYEPIALLPGSLASFLSVWPTAPVSIAGGLDEVVIQITPDSSQEFDVGLPLPAGSMFGVQFRVRDDAPLGTGSGNVTGSAIVTLANPLETPNSPEPLDPILVPLSASVSTTIVAVPEPATWATMLAGLALLGGAAARARRKAPSLRV